MKQKLRALAEQFSLQIIYAFGSRAQEAHEMLSGKKHALEPGPSDLDIGVKPLTSLSLDHKVYIAQTLEDMFHVPTVDLITIPDAHVFLAYEIVTGELLYAQDPEHEAEYQLFIMRQAAELIPYKKMKDRMILGF